MDEWPSYLVGSGGRRLHLAVKGIPTGSWDKYPYSLASTNSLSDNQLQEEDTVEGRCVSLFFCSPTFALESWWTLIGYLCRCRIRVGNSALGLIWWGSVNHIHSYYFLALECLNHVQLRAFLDVFIASTVNSDEAENRFGRLLNNTVTISCCWPYRCENRMPVECNKQ